MPGGENIIRISVRALVEFLFRSGDIDNRLGSGRTAEAMAQGSRIHRLIQGKMDSTYKAEVPLKETVSLPAKEQVLLLLEGRADGIFQGSSEDFSKQKAGITWCDGLPVFGGGTAAPPALSDAEDEAESAGIHPEQTEQAEAEPLDGRPELCENPEKDNTEASDIFFTIDEIKSMYRDVSALKEPYPVHLAQALCYAWIWMKQNDLPCIGVQLTYCQIETEHTRRFRQMVSRKDLDDWFEALLAEFAKWAQFQVEERRLRCETTADLEFPYPYRPGQRDMVVAVYRSIHQGKNLFVQAPTGVGKTLSTVFPAVRSMGEGIGEKLFYLTARNVTRQVAEESLRILRKAGLHFSATTITAKEKICPQGKAECRPDLCPYAKGHFDRVNDALYDLLTTCQEIRRPQLLETAEKWQVCPFELSLDACSFTDGILCDYNYAFDPNVNLKRFFADGTTGRYLFLVDEAHNLVDRARDMYSAVLVKEHFLLVKNQMKEVDRKICRKLDRCNQVLLQYKRECEKVLVLDDVNTLFLALTALMGEMEELRERTPGLDPGDDYRQLFFEVRHFLNMYENRGESYRIYAEYGAGGEFLLRLYCVHPAAGLKACLQKSVQTVFFSATLLPVNYYKELLGGAEEDYAIYVPSPFRPENRAIVVCRDVSSRYRARSRFQYARMAEEILAMAESREGHYMAFFPSYAFLRAVADELEVRPSASLLRILEQTGHMSEEEKEAFLAEFRTVEPGVTKLGLCVLGGSFSEGIDLKGEHLIGVAVVGIGLPQVCTEREMLRSFFDEKGKNGFDFAYRFPGMNKVQQAAGRVIRTLEDVGVILLMDDRFLEASSQELFPREWSSYYLADRRSLPGILEQFWSSRKQFGI